MTLRCFARGAVGAAALLILCSRPSAALPATFAEPLAAAQPVGVTLKLPLRNAAELELLTRLQGDPMSPLYHHFLTPQQFRARYAPLPDTLHGFTDALRASGLRTGAAGSQVVRAIAPADVVERAFAVRMGVVHDVRGAARTVADVVPTVPKALAALGVSVVGLDSRFAPRPQSRMLGVIRENRTSAHGGYWFDDLKQAYDYPAYARLDGRGVTIATVGLSDFSDSDAADYFGHERLGGLGALAAAPQLRHVALGGDPFDPASGLAGEANLDVQEAGGSAPGAAIVGVSVPSAGEGFLYGYSVLDDLNTADIVSTSYGLCELFYTPAYNGGVDQRDILLAYHDLFLQGNAQGITFVFASGDDGALQCPPPAYFASPGTGRVFANLAGVLTWTDDPNATSVGGTNLVTTSIHGRLTSTYVRESAVHDTIVGLTDPYGTGNAIKNEIWGSGGGASVVFKQPAFAHWAQPRMPMRTVPDVAMTMGGCPVEDGISGNALPVVCGPDDSYEVGYVGGQLMGFIGTSAAAPEFAGLLALLVQKQGGVRLGNVNGYIYGLARRDQTLPASARAFREGIPGSNGVISVPAGRLGYNDIVGIGTPIARNFLGLPGIALAGDPQTATNP